MEFQCVFGIDRVVTRSCLKLKIGLRMGISAQNFIRGLSFECFTIADMKCIRKVRLSLKTKGFKIIK